MAPWAATALAMPQAIERLLATPIMSPRLPCIRVPAGTALSAPGALIRSFLVVVGDAPPRRFRRGASYTPYAPPVHPGPPFSPAGGPTRLLVPSALIPSRRQERIDAPERFSPSHQGAEPAPQLGPCEPPHPCHRAAG